MTGILTCRTKEPTTCFVCQGVAHSVGTSNGQRGSSIQWTCLDCTKPASRIARMKTGDISRIESGAIDAVAKASIDAAFNIYLGALFDAGVAIAEPTEDQLSLARDSLIVNGMAPEFVRSIVLAFGDEVKAAVERGDAPF